MTKHERNLRRLMKSIAAPFAASVTIKRTNGCHIKVTFAVGQRSAFIITAFSPSDWRAQHQMKADARRTLRQLAGIAGPA